MQHLRDRALLSLEGLSLGDAFGQHLFRAPTLAAKIVSQRMLPQSPWKYSDDTAMALSVTEVLFAHRRVEQDALAAAFVRRFLEEESRGYGPLAYRMLRQMAEGQHWRLVSKQPHGGAGSMGNGAAMRVAPLGAWYADERGNLAREASASAEVTHAHPEGIAGAIAVAHAAATAHHARRDPTKLDAARALTSIAEETPEGEVRRGVREAAKLVGESPSRTAKVLGDGRRVTAPNTVPYALWCAMTGVWDFERALWRTMEGAIALDADHDTLGAIVGGIVALAVGAAKLPAEWIALREPLPALS